VARLPEASVLSWADFLYILTVFLASRFADYCYLCQALLPLRLGAGLANSNAKMLTYIFQIKYTEAIFVKQHSETVMG